MLRARESPKLELLVVDEGDARLHGAQPSRGLLDGGRQIVWLEEGGSAEKRTEHQVVVGCFVAHGNLPTSNRQAG